MVSLKVASLWRYPVKSMMGEELNACEMTENGLLGYRAYGVIDNETGKLLTLKIHKNCQICFNIEQILLNPRKRSWDSTGKNYSPNGWSIISKDEKKIQLLSNSFN